MDKELDNLLTNYKGTLSIRDQNTLLMLKSFDHVNFNLIDLNVGYIEFGKLRLKNKNLNESKNESKNELKNEDDNLEIDEKEEADNEEEDVEMDEDGKLKTNKKKQQQNLNKNKDKPIYKFLKQFKQPLIKSSIFNFPLDIKLDEVFLYDNECLDPRFLLFSIYQLINLRKVTLEEMVDSNCLAILLVSLSFKDENLRRIGYTVLVKFKQDLCNDVHGTIWRIILDKLSASLQEDNQLIPPVIMSFFVHLIPIIQKSTYSLNEKLLKFVIRDPTFKYNSIIGFVYNNMLMKDDPESNILYQEIGLLIFKNGLRTEEDFNLLSTCRIIDFLLINFNSPILLKHGLKLKVLDILYSASRLPLASKLLCTEKAFVFWLNQMIMEENKNLELLGKINRILNELLIHCDYYPLNQIELKLSKNICTKNIDFLMI